MKKISIITFCIVLALSVFGCGGNGNPLPPVKLGNAAGIWTGTITDAITHDTFNITLNVDQGPSSVGTDGIPVAPVTAAITFASPNCSGVKSGISSKGAVTGHNLSVTFDLNNGGTLLINTAILETTPPRITSNDNGYQFLNSTCASSGKVALSRN